MEFTDEQIKKCRIFQNNHLTHAAIADDKKSIKISTPTISITLSITNKDRFIVPTYAPMESFDEAFGIVLRDIFRYLDQIYSDGLLAKDDLGKMHKQMEQDE